MRAGPAVVMMNRLGRPGEAGARKAQLHRIFGWSFVAFFLILFGTMCAHRFG